MNWLVSICIHYSIFDPHCSWFYPLLCSYRCYDTHRMSNIKVCQRLSNKLHGYLWANGCFLWGFFRRRQVLIIPWTTHIVLSSFASTRPTTCPGETCVCGYQSVYRREAESHRLSQCSSPARLNKMATKQNRASTNFLLHLIKTVASEMAKGQKAR